jgi:long-subunit acyl-CoA synthetase (AMP-forming)
LPGGKFGDYEWQTFSEVDIVAESYSKAIIKRKLCPLVLSDVEGTPDLKFMAIFSENRIEWVITQLACCSDSICIVPVSVQNQFVNDNRICSILNQTEVSTICVSKSTIGVILDLKSKNLLKTLKNIITFDKPEPEHCLLSQQVGLEIHTYHQLVSEGKQIEEFTK